MRLLTNFVSLPDGSSRGILASTCIGKSTQRTSCDLAGFGIVSRRRSRMSNCRGRRNELGEAQSGIGEEVENLEQFKAWSQGMCSEKYSPAGLFMEMNKDRAGRTGGSMVSFKRNCMQEESRGDEELLEDESEDLLRNRQSSRFSKGRLEGEEGPRSRRGEEMENGNDEDVQEGRGKTSRASGRKDFSDQRNEVWWEETGSGVAKEMDDGERRYRSDTDSLPGQAYGGRGYEDELIRSRLQAMEEEQRRGEWDGGAEARGLSFRSKDRDAVPRKGWRAIRKVDSGLEKFPDGPVITRSSLIAKQVISQDSAMSMGFVVQVWTDVQRWKVVAIEVRPSMLFGLVEAIILPNLSQVGDVVLVPDEDALEGQLDWTGCEPLVGFDIFTENALYLGKVRDFDFNIENGGVMALEFDSFGVPLIPSSMVSTFSLPINEIVEVGEECLLVRNGAETRMKVLTKGLWGKISGDKVQSRRPQMDDRLALKSVARRDPSQGSSKPQLSRADISRAQKVADMYMSNRRYSKVGHGRGDSRMQEARQQARQRRPSQDLDGRNNDGGSGERIPEEDDFDS